MNEYEIKSFIISGKNRKIIVKLLLDNPQMPIEIAKKSNIRSQHINRTCKDLLNANIIQDLTPKNRRNKVYALTEIGEKIATLLNRDKLL